MDKQVLVVIQSLIREAFGSGGGSKTALTSTFDFLFDSNGGGSILSFSLRYSSTPATAGSAERTVTVFANSGEHTEFSKDYSVSSSAKIISRNRRKSITEDL